MRHFFTHKEIKLKKKRTAIAVIGIGLVLGIYFIVSRRPAHQQETPVVAIEPVTREDVEIYGEYVGRIRAQQFVEVRARVEGYLEQMLFAEGTYVTKNQVLFVINQEQYRAKADKARAQLKKDEAQALKAKRLLRRLHRFLSNKELYMTLRFSPQTRRVFHLSLPIFAELLLQLLVGNMDQFMISRFGSAAVAAIGNGNQVMNVVIIVLTTMSTAATILLTQHIGAGRVGEECSEIVTVAVTVSAVFSFLVGLFLLLEPELVFHLLRTPEDAFDGACLYTRIVGGTVLLQGLYIQLCAVLRSYTLLKEVVVLSVSMNLLNVVGNAILINGFFGFPQMGVAGAAVSTVISKAVGLTLACITLKRKCTVRFSLQYLRPFPAKTFRALLGIALPSGTEALSYNVSQTFILRFINLMGAAVVSAKVYGSMLANVAYVYSIAVGQATQIILGYMIGGRKLDEVSGRVWSTIRIALAASELLTLLILIFCDPIYSIFTDDPVIHALGRQILYVEFGLEIGRSINIVMTRCLTTAGDVWYPVGVGIFSMWIVAVGGSWLLGHALNWGLVGIWIAMACDECLRGALFTIRFRSGKWKETRLVSDSTKGT